MLTPASLLAITALLSAMMLLVMLSLRRSGLPGVREWIWANVLEVVSLASFLLLQQPVTLASIVVGNTLIAAGICCFWAGCRRFFKLSVPWRWIFLALLLQAIGLAWLRVPVDMVNARVILVSAFHAIVGIGIGYTILRHRPASRATHGHVLTASMAFFFAAGYIVRCFFYAQRQQNIVLLFDTSFMNLLFLSLGTMILPGLTMGAVVMAHDKLLSQAEAIANRDFLTGVLSRKAFVEQAAREMTRAARYGRALSLVIIDIDHFKAVNDRFGHATGDAILRDFTLLAQANVRDGDYIGRLGGEEFGILLPDTGEVPALAMAERLRQQVAARRYRAGEQIVRYTISGGVAVWRVEESLEDFAARSDSMLYQAKQSGRNQILAAVVPA